MSDTTSTDDLTAEDLTTEQGDLASPAEPDGTESTEGTEGSQAAAGEPASDEAATATDAAEGSGEGEDDTAGDDDTATPAKPEKGSRVRQLEREGEVAADFLETLLDIADLDGDLDVDVDGDRAAVAIVDSEEGRVPRRLVGPDGKVLEALQELTRLAVQVETGERSRLMLDIAGFRAERRAVLVELARVAIEEVKTSGEKKSLDPMSAFERKVVHDEVAAAGLESESEGVDPKRHVVILPA
jgi:spoIIIJ-associated protein